jgi:hypothetical protein
MSVILEHQSLNVENLLNPESPKGDMMKKKSGLCVHKILNIPLKSIWH